MGIQSAELRGISEIVWCIKCEDTFYVFEINFEFIWKTSKYLQIH